jgi:hypothetical protein
MRLMNRTRLAAVVLLGGLVFGRVVVAEEPRAEEPAPYAGLAVMLDLLVTAAEPEAKSDYSVVALPLVGVKGYIPVHEMITISPSIDIGWFELSGSGTRELENDPDFTAYSYSCSMDNLLLFVGVSVALKPLDEIPLYASVGGGFATTYSWAESTYQREGEEPVENAVQAGWGVGYYLGLEAAYELGPGRFILEYRYSSIQADLGFENVYGGQYSQQTGDLGGSNILLGYRLNIPW